ncbi:MAG: NADH-quinone oxidoreductase subunit J [Alphaproteobacteria bacterium]
MIIQGLAFYAFAIVLIAAGFLVISARNPVHSVLFLILAFFNAAGLFVLMGAEFLALILVVVYVGAVAVLFLFVVMMLDINFRELRRGFLQYLPIGAMVGLVLLAELVLLVGSWQLPEQAVPGAQATATPDASEVTNVAALGQVLYTHYVYLFLASGIVLLIAMIGAIVLTLRQRVGVRRQSIPDQIDRKRAETIEVRKVQSRTGV